MSEPGRPRRSGAGPSPLPVGGVRVALEAVRVGRAAQVLLAVGGRDTPALRELRAACRAAGVAVRKRPRSELDRIAVDHHGVVAQVRLPAPLSERDLGEWPYGPEDLVVVLDGVLDPQNLGAAARSAEAAGAAILVTRTRRAAPVTPAAVRASSGALLHLPHAQVANLTRAIGRLQGAGFTVVGLDEAAGSSVYAAPGPSGPVAVVVGSEGRGLSRLVGERCDALVSLPMLGRVSSLNASAALAAVLYAYVLPGRARGVVERTLERG